jgi:general stress protein YciG
VNLLVIKEKIMAGTKAGGQKAAQTNKTKHGSDFYAKIGAKGGKNGRTGGFAANPELARIAGAKGGRISRRKKTTVASTATQKDFDLAA